MGIETKQQEGGNPPTLERAPTMAEIFTEDPNDFDVKKWQDDNYLNDLIGQVGPGKIYPTVSLAHL